MATMTPFGELLTISSSGKKSLSAAGSEAFTSVYNSFHFQEFPVPTVTLSPTEYAMLKEIAKLRMKDWASTSRWNESADVTGLLGELVSQHYFGFSVEKALADFLDGLRGDWGVDFQWAGEAVDVKSTRGQALRYRFSEPTKRPIVQQSFSFLKLPNHPTAPFP